MSLSEKIKQYYLNNLSSLPKDKQFHFASRLAAWEGNNQAYKILMELRNYMIPNEEKEDLQKLLKGLVETPQVGISNAHELRRPYFSKYPDLWGTHLALFRVRHLKFIYQVDAIDQLLTIVGQEKLEKMSNDLMKDEEAIRILSTFAINFLYLYKVILLNQPEFVTPGKFLDLNEGYDLTNKEHIQLLVYLFTHCIIGDSNFYIRHVNSANLDSYHTMLNQLDQIISDNFALINLDNKLEFLVCCRICDFSSSLDEKIEKECINSISEDGDFLIDRHNLNAQENRKSFEKSEHRSVLYIMSQSPFRPYSTLI